MKNLSIILAIFFLAFTVEAQTVQKSKRIKERKATKTSVLKSRDKPSKAKKIRPPSTSKKRDVKTSSAAKRSSSNRNSKYSSESLVTRSSKTRSNNSASPTTRTSTKTRISRDNTYSSVSSRKLTTESSNTRTRSTGTSVLVGQRDSKSRSVRSNVYTPKTSSSHAASRKVYVNNNRHKLRRAAPSKHYTHRSIDYRRLHNPYRKPVVFDIYWNINMHRNYRNWYPNFNLWYYPYGYRINTISAYDSYNYIGEVARIYGKVTEVWYSREAREYYLYIGGPYPYQDFTIILEARDAKRFSWDPERYFTNRRLAVTGLVSLFEDKPEMLIRKRSQVRMY